MLPQKKIKIALTGGIGTGKTYISKQFLDMGIPVFYADEEAKKLYLSEEVIAFFKEKYESTCFTNNQLDFSKLATHIFSNLEHRKQIEAFIHPLVMQKFENWASQQNSSIVMMESAIVFEAGLENCFDKIIVVDAPLDVRIERIKSRNLQLSEAEIWQRIHSQLPQKEKCKYADLVIWNA
ncbi:MAG: dephospho-CoA kinase [Bacteroidetes bacterium]|nr:dephospho-CoA kinase [Bacteroidota bacterium]MCL2302618.1 dephospho-CoA kinase [Lentimicrobiaceae bacterium]